MPHPRTLGALCAFTDELARLPDPRRVRHVLSMLLGTRLVALARGTNIMSAVAAFTHDY